MCGFVEKKLEDDDDVKIIQLPEDYPLTYCSAVKLTQSNMNKSLMTQSSASLDCSQCCGSPTLDGAPAVCQDPLGQPSGGQVEAASANQAGRGLEGEAAMQRHLQARPQQRGCSLSPVSW